MKKYEEIGVRVPKILLPREGIDLEKWAVVACDQYTSQKEYWEELYHFVGDSPSTLHLILPEAYLEDPDVDERIARIHQTMIDYLQRDILEEIESLIYVERELSHGVRKGLLVALDLEKYDFHQGSKSIIRATEATIVDRIPPRLKIREGASLELPHIMILIDDEKKSVIEPISESKNSLSLLYQFTLNKGGGEIRGYAIKDPVLEKKVLEALGQLAEAEYFHNKYHLPSNEPLLVFAVGDGNHSMATAKTFWEKIRSSVLSTHAARYALVELVNLYDEGLFFEPIHRLLIGVNTDIINKATQFFSNVHFESVQDYSALMAKVKEESDIKASESHRFGFISEGKLGCLTVHNPKYSLAVATLQNFLDYGLQEKWFNKIDYIHGDEVIGELAAKPQQAGFFLPPIDKKSLFKTVIAEGNLPRKAFSMGHAHEKRYYMECRNIRS